MSRFFSHPEYAEDQPLSHTILTTHVLYRGFQTGALLGGLPVLTRSIYRHYRPSSIPTPSPISTTPASNPTSTPLPRPSLLASTTPPTLRFTGLGGTFGILLLTLGLWVRMRGREEIEWRDRAWRLLENEGQVSVDEFSVGGMVAGVGLAVLAARRGKLVVRDRPMAVVGAAGVGSLVGTGGSLGFRGVKMWVGGESKGEGEMGQKRLLEE